MLKVVPKCKCKEKRTNKASFFFLLTTKSVALMRKQKEAEASFLGLVS